MKESKRIFLALAMCFFMAFSMVTPAHAATKKCTHPTEVMKVVKKATCTTDGKITYTCKKCGKLLHTNKVKKLGHKWQLTKLSDAKHHKLNVTRKCKRCKKTATKVMTEDEFLYSQQ